MVCDGVCSFRAGSTAGQQPERACSGFKTQVLHASADNRFQQKLRAVVCGVGIFASCIDIDSEFDLNSCLFEAAGQTADSAEDIRCDNRRWPLEPLWCACLLLFALLHGRLPPGKHLAVASRKALTAQETALRQPHPPNWRS